MACQTLKVYLKLGPPFFNELFASVSNDLLGRNDWHKEAVVPILQPEVEVVKVTVANLLIAEKAIEIIPLYGIVRLSIWLCRRICDLDLL